MLLPMEKKPPADDSKNRFAEVIKKSRLRRAELDNQTKRKQMEDTELPPRDEEVVDTEVVDTKEEDEPED
jgi:hypothetical protein